MAVVGISLSTVASAGDPSLFATKVEPSAALAGIQVGMSIEDAKLALRSFEVDDTYQDAANRKRLIKPAPGGTKYYVLLADNVVSRIGIEAPEKGLVAKLTKQWGKPSKAVNAASEGITSWSAGEWRVDLACRQALCRLAFHRSLTPAFFGRSVAPPAALGSIKLGMTRDQIAAVFASGAEVPAGPEDVRLTVDVGKDGLVRSVVVAGLPPNAGELMSAAWGPATDVDSKPTWFNPNTGWRARYDQNFQLLQLTEYMPVMSLLGTGEKLALPLIGLTPDQLAKVYPKLQTSKAGMKVALPPTEFATALTMIGLSFDPRTGKTAAAVFALPFDTLAHKDLLVKVLEAKWGKGQEQIQRGQRVMTFPAAKTRVQVHVDGANELLVELR
ncbi:MAG: hypothetical protein H0T42_08230 [Deltaproteobacteria bacterium]|nr:hypothetical protein [Deltaproteobacteria bacterium]